MALTYIEASERKATRNIVLYGPPGSGKTAGALTAPGPVLLANAEGETASEFPKRLNSADGKVIREVAVTGKDVLRDVMLALKDNADGFKTVVVDTSGEAYRILTDEASGGKTPQVQHYGDAGYILERFYRYLRDLPLNVVIVAHEEMVDGPDGEQLMPQAGGKKLTPKVCGMVDIVAYVRAVAPADDSDDRRVRYFGQMQPGRNRYAKDRNGALGAFRELDLTEWIHTSATAPITLNEER